MQRENRQRRKHIAYFNPDVTSLEQAHQDFLSQTKLFNAGAVYKNFNDFLYED